MNDNRVRLEEAPMALSGQLEVFPLEEVLRLLARAHQTGCLRVEGPANGRIYLTAGSLSLVTVQSDDELRRQLIASGLTAEQSLGHVESGSGTLAEALAADVSPASLTEFVKEQCVENLYRVRQPRAGSFVFSLDAAPRYATGQSFDLEMLVSEADRRALEWQEIGRSLPDLAAPLGLVPTLDGDEVTLRAGAWRMLAALTGERSVRQVATVLGLTEFQAARAMSDLARQRLIGPVGGEESGPGRPMPADADSVSGWEPAEPLEPVAGASSPVERRGDSEAFLESVFGELDPGSGQDDDGDDPEGFGLLRQRGLGASFRDPAGN